MLFFEQLAHITGGRVVQFVADHPIHHLLTDSRKLVTPESALFFAISGERHDGHQYIPELYARGVRQFIFRTESPQHLAEWQTLFPEANLLEVQDPVLALQQVAAHHRSKYTLPVVGITGSNGKTIVKEWLSQLVSPDEVVVKSPKSYNSQIGVPLSVWQLQNQHTVGIFEAGISLPGEMARLKTVIQPTLGIFTNIGSAHDEGFTSRAQKITEKLLLFSKVARLIISSDQPEVLEAAKKARLKTFTWGRHGTPDLLLVDTWNLGHATQLELEHKKKRLSLLVPFTDEASIENCLHCIAFLLYRKMPVDVLQQRLRKLAPVGMRLELKEALHDCYLIDDSYNNDLAGLTIALDFLQQQQQRPQRILILSDLLESGLEEGALYNQVAELIAGKHVSRLIGIGPVLTRNAPRFKLPTEFYPSTEQFIRQFDLTSLRSATVLVKGARVFRFEKIVQLLQQRVHGTVLEVNLDALVHNLNYYRSKLRPTTKVMVMVKAFAYGSGSFEVANLLQYHRVDYLAVAYTDEGVALRQNGITLPVMVMNPSAQTFTKLIQHRLEPEVFSLSQLRELLDFLAVNHPGHAPVPIHLKLDTGMHRLGLEPSELDEACRLLAAHEQVRVATVFTHLAGADEALHNDFSLGQMTKFRQMANRLEIELGYSPMRHVLNSAGIIRFPEQQYDMVRLGIGLYGIESSGTNQQALQAVGTLRTTISQVKHVRKGETVGYSRKGVAEHDSQIATIAIGYADGYDRRFSQGIGEVLVHGQRAPVIGNVCMDMTMIDISGIDAKAGDPVVVFGPDLSLSELAGKIGTIAYELLTNVSSRVKRVFYSE
jgi:alanine racemase